MSYIEGFVVPVPTANRTAYREMSAKLAPMFHELGAISLVECWGEEVPDGNVTDFKRSVALKPDETVVFAWLVWPSKQVREAAGEKMKTDPRMQPSKDNPFDAKRMIYGGFEIMLDTGGSCGKVIK